MNHDQIKPGDLVKFDFESTKLFSSYLASLAFSSDETVFAVQHNEIGIVISSPLLYAKKIPILFSKSKKILLIDIKRLSYICDISE
jgi:hypothetical protein